MTRVGMGAGEMPALISLAMGRRADRSIATTSANVDRSLVAFRYFEDGDE